jgi:hypothetical protein
MVAAARVMAFFDTPSKPGDKTRRQKFAEFGQSVPEPDIPDGCDYLWTWFLDVLGDVRDGVLGYTSLAAWATLYGVTPRPEECRILRAMCAAFAASARKVAEAKKAPASK